ncbi:MAG: hypothetical protein ACPLXA_00990 [Moorellaceae bacterium]
MVTTLFITFFIVTPIYGKNNDGPAHIPLQAIMVEERYALDMDRYG